MALTSKEIRDTILSLSSGNVILIVIFGSWARGEATPVSDIDVAILTTIRDKLKRSWVRAEVSSALNGPDMKTDIVTIEDVNWSFRYRIARDGEVIYDKGNRWEEFLMAVMQHYPDFKRYEENFFRCALREIGASIDIIPIKQRLNKILIELEDLESISGMSFEDFAKDTMLIRAVERVLEIISQAIIDVASQIIAEMKLSLIPSYRETVIVLANHHIIDRELAQRLSKFIGMRNVIVHGYMDVDVKMIYDAIERILSDAQEFVEAIRSKLESGEF